ncbi:MAG: hypothetical protein WC548_04505 [Candidatus Pacearchaeota archaeon]
MVRKILGIIKDLPLYLAIGTLVGGIFLDKHLTRPQTRNVIGDPNARDVNDVYMERDGKKYFYSVDGRSVEDLVDEVRR